MQQFVNEKLEEFNNFIRYRKVAVIGLGVSNIPLLDYLFEKKAKVTVFDEKEREKIPKNIMNKLTAYSFDYYLGKDCLKNLKNFVLIFRSPSCLPTRIELQDELERGAIVTTEIEMLMKMCPCPIIGVTGSEGKTTTTSMINSILVEGGYNTYVGGNIGTPLFTKLIQIKPEDVVILELSSFQLMDMEVSPQTAVVTNVTPNHLNIHTDYKEYIEAKKNIYKYQNEDGVVILNYDNKITRKMKKDAKGKVVFFSSKTRLDNGYIVEENAVKECDNKLRKHIIYGDEIKLKGIHNFENICAAVAATKSFVKQETVEKALKKFEPVEHRLEFVRELDKVQWYNDSASSSPTRTIAGLRAFPNKQIVLIAGGSDKDLNYSPIAKPVIESVTQLILIGETSKKIERAVEKEIRKQRKQINIYQCKSLKEAVRKAKEVAKPEQVVLFSPASASFDMFKNAYERGKIFKKLVNDL